MRISWLIAALVLTDCNRSSDAGPPASTEDTPSNLTAAPAGRAGPALGKAVVGKPAPDFTLPDLDGKTLRLSDYRGKVVVLEWFNPGCPFVNLSHEKGSLKGLAKRHARAGVIWLAINSGAPGKQGHGVDVNRGAMKRFDLSHPLLVDESGSVGRAYGAERTPHLYVIDTNGVLVYRGAIDNSPDGEGESPRGGTLINYVDAALEDLAAARPVRTQDTEAYGCSVKYGS